MMSYALKTCRHMSFSVNSNLYVQSGEELKQEGLLKSFTNLSDHVVIKSQKKVSDSKLQHLELGLARARASIRGTSKYINNQIPYPNLIPVGPMYWNSHAFHR
ncbi:hypothetical protein MKX01_020421 [Papaver californicum]|nr:hypothetical protein MKX01_020421 [Papaver californicum]